MTWSIFFAFLVWLVLVVQLVLALRAEWKGNYAKAAYEMTWALLVYFILVNLP